MQPVVHQGPQSFYTELFLRQLVPSLCCCMSLLCSRCRTIAGLHEILVSPFFSDCLRGQFVLPCQVERVAGLGVASQAAQLSHLSSSCLQRKGRVGNEAQTPYICRTPFHHLAILKHSKRNINIVNSNSSISNFQ